MDRKLWIYDLEWKISPSFKNYEVSNFGDVRNGSTMRMLEPCIVNGYYRTTLNNDNKDFNVVIHRIVAEAFISNPLNKKEVNHIDGNKLNNNVANLEWVTRSENALHSYKLGLQKKVFGKNHHNSKKILFENTNIIYGSIIECSKDLNINCTTIIESLKRNKPLKNGYNFKRIE